jgi:hypothetical protein
LRDPLAKELVFELQLFQCKRVHTDPRQRRTVSAVRDYRGFWHKRQDGAKQAPWAEVHGLIVSNGSGPSTNTK